MITESWKSEQRAERWANTGVGHARGLECRGDHRVARPKHGPGDVDAHTATGTGEEPNLLRIHEAALEHAYVGCVQTDSSSPRRVSRRGRDSLTGERFPHLWWCTPHGTTLTPGCR